MDEKKIIKAVDDLIVLAKEAYGTQKVADSDVIFLECKCKKCDIKFSSQIFYKTDEGEFLTTSGDYNVEDYKARYKDKKFCGYCGGELYWDAKLGDIENPWYDKLQDLLNERSFSDDK